ncbi:hypothetical protein M408DRAFT_173655 [Serendipita vermifera MAFF 305830]|uniref:Uncharacterized protein n=1 Tax=Serendipita vermifera MAFF 305830 TaxID=933852 RepID=A0A0C2WLD8_SERVB|nr:hypothetical protein M408DRAFT_173655 [Serendipita vermifera MAFF 305830]
MCGNAPPCDAKTNNRCYAFFPFNPCELNRDGHRDPDVRYKLANFHGTDLHPSFAFFRIPASFSFFFLAWCFFSFLFFLPFNHTTTRKRMHLAFYLITLVAATPTLAVPTLHHPVNGTAISLSKEHGHTVPGHHATLDLTSHNEDSNYDVRNSVIRSHRTLSLPPPSPTSNARREKGYNIRTSRKEGGTCWPKGTSYPTEEARRLCYRS